MKKRVICLALPCLALPCLAERGVAPLMVMESPEDHRRSQSTPSYLSQADEAQAQELSQNVNVIGKIVTFVNLEVWSQAPEEVVNWAFAMICERYPDIYYFQILGPEGRQGEGHQHEETMIPLTDLSPLKNLKYLHTLYLERIEAQDLSPLRGLEQLRSVSLRNMTVSSAMLRDLEGIPLETLDIYLWDYGESFLSKEDLLDLSKAMPGVFILLWILKNQGREFLEGKELSREEGARVFESIQNTKRWENNKGTEEGSGN